MIKTILVGNGTSLLDHNFGNKIDSFDLVVRFNMFKIFGYEQNVGSKVDIWALNEMILLKNFHYEWLHYPIPQPPAIIMAPFDGHRHYDDVLKIGPLPENTTIISREDAYKISQEYDSTYKCWPSTGMMAIFYFKPCTIIGFDGFTKLKNNHFEYAPWYENQDIGHNQERECYFLKKFIDSGEIECLDNFYPSL
jgi:hypothetical protein